MISYQAFLITLYGLQFYVEIGKHVCYYITYNGAPFMEKEARVNKNFAKYKKHFRGQSFKYNF